MANQQHHDRSVQERLQALAAEIQQLRSEYIAAVDHHDAMQAHAVASQFRVENLGRRLEEAEQHQRQLLGSAVLPPIGTGRAQAAYSSGGGARGGASDPRASLPIGCGAPAPSHSLSRSNISEVSSISTIRPHDDTASTSLSDTRHLQPQSNISNNRHNLALLRPAPYIPSSAQAQQATFGSTENAIYLPMVIETILAENKRYEREDRLRTW
ncbi:hypothetical protein Ptr902_05089 [Pyrenophora tritici-repentis]|nr:hypothetical protein PtrV1_04494 [Pyrenophora tritici-repentis]KAI1531525.1 hypothetical protein PtrSN001C_008287 [Pyrenophora tritici-repentis]KAI1577492.1 hypothetical protein PtrEW7m1_005908 [Pyrenophora tritici-repentis]KAI1581281.1 hypothetical protein PtrEW13061_009669 [Pyrenophora tritici-repentis]KAI1598120.1 hypothetical protein PtrCC142_008415 [Pyrenophora tritici-repentis]